MCRRGIAAELTNDRNDVRSITDHGNLEELLDNLVLDVIGGGSASEITDEIETPGDDGSPNKELSRLETVTNDERLNRELVEVGFAEKGLEEKAFEEGWHRRDNRESLKGVDDG